MNLAEELGLARFQGCVPPQFDTGASLVLTVITTPPLLPPAPIILFFPDSYSKSEDGSLHTFLTLLPSFPISLLQPLAPPRFRSGEPGRRLEPSGSREESGGDGGE